MNWLDGLNISIIEFSSWLEAIAALLYRLPKFETPVLKWLYADHTSEKTNRKELTNLGNNANFETRVFSTTKYQKDNTNDAVYSQDFTIES